jgi:hypothetical protein
MENENPIVYIIGLEMKIIMIILITSPSSSLPSRLALSFATAVQTDRMEAFPMGFFLQHECILRSVIIIAFNQGWRTDRRCVVL